MIDATPIQHNLNPNAHYFQTQSISRHIKDYIEHASDSICNRNPYRHRYHTNNDVAIHIRLTDVAQYNPGILYYKKALTECNSYDRIYIATDEPSHPIVQELLLYPNAVYIDKDDITTIQFASTCTHIILSHGSFSALLGYLSFFSEVIYPAYDHMWYGDLFSIDGWKQIKI